MSFRRSTQLVCVIVSMSFVSCHSSTELGAGRELTVCVDTKSFTGFGRARPAPDAKVFAIINGSVKDLEFAGIAENCARFFGIVHRSDVLSSVTAFLSNVGASTLLDVSSDEVRLRIVDIALPITDAATVKLRGDVIRTEADSWLYLAGDGLDNPWVYGNSHNNLTFGEGEESFEFDLGTWDGAPETVIYAVERSIGEDFSDPPKVTTLTVDRDQGTESITIDLRQIDDPHWRKVQHRARFAKGVLSCNGLRLRESQPYSAPVRGRPEIMKAYIDCADSGDIHVEGFVIDSARWIVHQYDGFVEEMNAYGGGVIQTDSENKDDYIIPNISSYEIQFFSENAISGGVYLSGASSTTSIALSVEMGSDSGYVLWNIFSDNRDSLVVDENEYSLIYGYVEEAFSTSDTTFTLRIVDGYGGRFWESWFDEPISHRLNFSFRLNSSL